jgi:hypothetical protein
MMPEVGGIGMEVEVAVEQGFASCSYIPDVKLSADQSWDPLSLDSSLPGAIIIIVSDPETTVWSVSEFVGQVYS